MDVDQQSDNLSLTYDPTYVKQLETYLSSMTELAKQNIINQRRYKQHYDSNRSDPSYNIGELVLIKTLNNRSRFDTRFEEPFRIIQKLGPKTYVVQHTKKLTLHRQVTVDVMLPIFERKY